MTGPWLPESFSRQDFLAGNRQFCFPAGGFCGAAQHRGFADELAHEQGGRLVIELAAGADLLDTALIEDGDAVGEHQRLFLVVGDVDEGGSKLAMDALDLELQPFAQLLVERAERLVHQQQRRIEDDGTGERHALLLAAGQLARITMREFRHLDHVESWRTRLSRSLFCTTAQGQRIGDVLADRHMRKQSVVLEHDPDIALVRGEADDAFAADVRSPEVRSVKPGDHVKVVVLPEPLGPSNVMNSPGSI